MGAVVLNIRGINFGAAKDGYTEATHEFKKTESTIVYFQHACPETGHGENLSYSGSK